MAASTHASAEVRLADRVYGAPTGMEFFKRLKEAWYKILRMNYKGWTKFLYISVETNKEKY